jgi:hypothetical protein
VPSRVATLQFTRVPLGSSLRGHLGEEEPFTRALSGSTIEYDPGSTAALILALFVTLAAGVLAARAFRDSPSGAAARSKNVPHWLAFHRLILAQAADYEHSHPGVSCETDPPHNVYATQLTCKRPNGREFGLMLLVAGQP